HHQCTDRFATLVWPSLVQVADIAPNTVVAGQFIPVRLGPRQSTAIQLQSRFGVWTHLAPVGSEACGPKLCAILQVDAGSVARHSGVGFSSIQSADKSDNKCVLLQ